MFRASHFLNVYSARYEAMRFVSKCSEPARLKTRSLFEQVSMLHYSRNISDRRIQQPGFYQLVQTKGGKGRQYKLSGRGAQLVAYVFVFLGSIICNLVAICHADGTCDQRPSCLAYDALCFKPLTWGVGGGGGGEKFFRQRP